MALLATEKVLTLDYWKTASQVVVGDYVFDRHGNPVKVTSVQQYMGAECHEVEFNDLLRVSGDSRLGFMLETPKYRNRIVTYKGIQKFRRPLKHFDVAALRHLELLDRRQRLIFSVPTAEPLKLPHQDLPVPPFIFGFWFFARQTNKKMTPPKGLGDFVRENFKDCGYKLKSHSLSESGEREFSALPTVDSQFAPHIPTKLTNNYLLSAPDQRLELLRGILSAKPRQYSVSKDRFNFTCRQLDTITRVQYLAESLGCRTRMLYDEIKKDYRLFFKSRLPLLPHQVSPPIKVHQSRRYIRNILSIQPQMCVHIETTSQDSTILVGEGFIPCR
jgi:hypothetical protein